MYFDKFWNIFPVEKYFSDNDIMSLILHNWSPAEWDVSFILQREMEQSETSSFPFCVPSAQAQWGFLRRRK